MKIAVIGGTGLVGSRVGTKLREHGHDAVAASPNTGVNALTGEGLGAALAGAKVVVDVSNAPSFEASAVMHFFTTATRNLLSAGHAAGVRHHVALSVIGTDRLTESAYFRAKLAQEELIRTGPVPFTIVRATQFFEFVAGIADSATTGGTVRLTSAGIQPMAADDVATAVCRIAEGEPVNGIVEIAGPDVFAMDDLVRQALAAGGDSRVVANDPRALYFGARLGPDTLLPGANASLAATRFDDWLARRRQGNPA